MLVFGDSDSNGHDNRDDDNDEHCGLSAGAKRTSLRVRTRDTKTPPLLSPSCSCLVDCSSEFSVGFCDMLIDLLASLFNLRYCRFLLHNCSFQVLEQLSKYQHVFFDLLDGIMTTANCASDVLRLASAITVDELS